MTSDPRIVGGSGLARFEFAEHNCFACGSLNRNGLGIPTEAFGFSNNPSTVAGLPAFRSVRLNVPKAGLTTRIQLR